MQYFVATRDGSRLGLEAWAHGAERCQAESYQLQPGADDLIRLDAFTIETDEAGVEVYRLSYPSARVQQ